MHLSDLKYNITKTARFISDEEQKNKISNSEPPENFEWFNVKNLHVHHKYYKMGLKPWEYPDDALETYCWICHENLHKEQKIDVYTKEGIKASDLTPCVRCFGAGHFPEYNHV
mgnify:CR=1 FL=1